MERALAHVLHSRYKLGKLTAADLVAGGVPVADPAG